MSDSTTIIIQRIAGPNTGICIIKPVIIGIVIQFFPRQMTNKYRPHLTGICNIPCPVKVPEEFINIAKIHVIVMHLIVLAGITANISITILRGSPTLFRPCQIQYRILSRMRDRIRDFSYLTGSIRIEVRPGTIMPAKRVSGISSTPATKWQRHPTAPCSHTSPSQIPSAATASAPPNVLR